MNSTQHRLNIRYTNDHLWGEVSPQFNQQIILFQQCTEIIRNWVHFSIYLFIASNIVIVIFTVIFFSLCSPCVKWQKLMFIQCFCNSKRHHQVLSGPFGNSVCSHVTWMINKGRGSCSWKHHVFRTSSCLIAASWSVSDKIHCVSQRAADLRSVSAGSVPAAADWISGRAWCSVLIGCLREGALITHNYFHFSDNKWGRGGISRDPT